MNKYLPYVFGGLVGLLVAQLSWPLAIVTFLALQIPFTGYSVVSALKEPEKVEYCPDRETITQFDRTVQALREKGFKATPNIAIDGSTLAVLVHPKESIQASVFQTDTAPAKVSFGFESEFENGAKLNSGEVAGIIPVAEGSFAQAFTKTTPIMILKEHKDALKYLQEQGLKVKPPPTEMPTAEDLRKSHGETQLKNRKLFKKSFLKNSWLALVRAVGGPNPYKVKVEDQPKVRARFGSKAKTG